MLYITYAFIAITLFTSAIVAQSSQNPCESEQVREFDFWVGTWDLEWKGPKGEVQKGTNEITRILDGCVVRESFDGGKDLSLKGQSYSMFDRNSGKWKQTWVDNQGSYLDFTGEKKDGKMTLSREFTNRQGKLMMQRMVFFNVRPDSLDWNWENSTDGGKTWNLVWHISYQRRK
jgi:hypothetical protein